MVGTAITAGIIVPTGLIAKSAIQAGISFESAFAGVRKTVDGSEQDFARLREGIREMAREIPASADEIAAVAEAAGQLGIQKDSILDFTRVMIDLGNSTNLSSDQAATALARLANITQMPQDSFDELGSTIVALGNNLATTEAEIVEMGLRIAGAGAQIGLTEAEILSFAGALSSVGIEAEAGGTAISRVMIDIASSVKTGGDKLETFAEVAGMSVAEFKAAFEDDAAGAVIEFIEGLDQISESGGNVFAVLEELELGEIRVRDALLRASGAGDLFRESLVLGNDAWRENNALTTEAAERYETTASKLQIFRNQLTDAGITIFDRLEPAIGRMLDDLTAFTQSAEFDAILDDFAADLEGVAGDLSAFIQNDLPGLAQGLGEAASAGIELATAFGDVATKANDLNTALDGEGFKMLLGGAVGAKAGSAFGPWGAAIGFFLGIAIPGLDDLNELLNITSDKMHEILGLPAPIEWIKVAKEVGEGTSLTQEQIEALTGVLTGDFDAAVAATNQRLAEEKKAFDQAQFAARFHSEAVMESAAATREAVDAVAELAAGLDVAHIINASWNNSVATAAQNVSHWEGMTTSAQSALDILNQRIADGIPLSEEQQEQYNLLTQGVERYKGGVEDQQDAFIKAEADRVKYTQGLDDLNQQLKDGAINLDTYEQRAAELAEGIDPAIVSQANLQTATEQLYGKMEDLVDVIYRIMEALGLLPEEEHIEFTAGLEPFENALAEVEGTEPEGKSVPVDADTSGWQDGWDPVVQAEADPKVVAVEAQSEAFDAAFAHVESLKVTPKTGDFGADISDWQLNYDTVEGAELSDKTAYLYANNDDAMAGINTVENELAALDGRSATVYVNVQTADTANAEFMMGGIPQYASGGRVSHDQLALVGEEGPELVMLPGGAEVLSAAKTRGMLSNAGGGLGFTLTANLDIQPALDNLYELARYVPHSPAETGPFSKEPDWDWVFQGISDAVKEATKDAEDSMAAFDAAMRDYNVWDFVIGDLESIVSGEAQKRLERGLGLLNEQLQLAIELGAPQAIIDGLNAAIAQTEARLEDVGRVLGTEVAQGFAAGMAAAEQQQATEDWWHNTLDIMDQVIRDADTSRFEDAVAEAQRRLTFAQDNGAPAEIVKQLEEELSIAQQELLIAGAALAEALEAGWIPQVEAMTDETVDQLLAMMEELDKKMPGGGAKLAEEILDEVVGGLFDGRVELEQALELIPRELLSALEAMEQALIVDLAEAFATGADNVDILNEQLRILGELLDGVRDSAAAAAVAVGTFVPGRGYYYSEGIYTTAGNGSNLSTMGQNFQTFAGHKSGTTVNGNITVNTTVAPNIDDLLDGVLPA